MRQGYRALSSEKVRKFQGQAQLASNYGINVGGIIIVKCFSGAEPGCKMLRKKWRAIV